MALAPTQDPSQFAPERVEALTPAQVEQLQSGATATSAEATTTAQAQLARAAGTGSAVFQLGSQQLAQRGAAQGAAGAAAIGIAVAQDQANREERFQNRQNAFGRLQAEFQNIQNTLRLGLGQLKLGQGRLAFDASSEATRAGEFQQGFGLQETALTADIGFRGRGLDLQETALTADIGFRGQASDRADRALTADIGFRGAESTRADRALTADIGFRGAASDRAERGLTADIGFSQQRINISQQVADADIGLRQQALDQQADEFTQSLRARLTESRAEQARFEAQLLLNEEQFGITADLAGRAQDLEERQQQFIEDQTALERMLQQMDDLRTGVSGGATTVERVVSNAAGTARETTTTRSGTGFSGSFGASAATNVGGASRPSNPVGSQNRFAPSTTGLVALRDSEGNRVQDPALAAPDRSGEPERDIFQSASPASRRFFSDQSDPIVPGQPQFQSEFDFTRPPSGFGAAF